MKKSQLMEPPSMKRYEDQCKLWMRKIPSASRAASRTQIAKMKGQETKAQQNAKTYQKIQN